MRYSGMIRRLERDIERAKESDMAKTHQPELGEIMTHPKADGLNALKRGEINALTYDVMDELLGKFITGIHWPGEIIMATIDHLAQRGMLVPDGWVAVPREPTIEMTNKVVKYFTLSSKNLAVDCYKAMIAAAPKGNNNDKL